MGGDAIPPPCVSTRPGCNRARPARLGVPEFDWGRSTLSTMPSPSLRCLRGVTPRCLVAVVAAIVVALTGAHSPRTRTAAPAQAPSSVPACIAAWQGAEAADHGGGRAGFSATSASTTASTASAVFMRLPLPSGGGQLRQEPVTSLPCGLAPMAPCLRPWRVRAEYRVITACRASSRASPSSCRFFARSGSVIPSPISGDSALIPRFAPGCTRVFPELFPRSAAAPRSVRPRRARSIHGRRVCRGAGSETAPANT